MAIYVKAHRRGNVAVKGHTRHSVLKEHKLTLKAADRPHGYAEGWAFRRRLKVTGSHLGAKIMKSRITNASRNRLFRKYRLPYKV